MSEVRRIRREARECALQFLFGLEFTKDEEWPDQLEAFWAARPAWAEMWQDDVDSDWAVLPQRRGVRRYADRLVKGIFENLEPLDAEITEALENWTPERVGRIEWSILRIALYEMRHLNDIPDAVAIDEAIEIAKLYGTEETPRFVNGVLDRLRRA